ncbi:hypothetical protein M3Y96_00821900 [Aphelenchoides besseyi]|nr:hypothetical protein M3Y96_00821900 [Aphelenchoides besseyi]
MDQRLDAEFLSKIPRISNINIIAINLLVSKKVIPSTELPDSLMQTPYFNEEKLVVAASLNSGNVFELLIQKITNFYDQLYEHGTEHLLGSTAVGIVENLSEMMPEKDQAKKSFSNSPIIVDEQSVLSAAYGSAVHALEQSMT